MQSITFTAQARQQELIDALIQSGEYKTIDEAMNTAMSFLEGNHATKIQRLRRLIKESDDSGPPLTINEEEFLQELRNEPYMMRHKLGL